MNKSLSLLYAVLGITLVLTGILFKQYPLFDSIANIGASYIAGMVGLAVLVVGVHCLIFSSTPNELPLVPNMLLFLIIAGAFNINIIWDGKAMEQTNEDIWRNLSNSIEFTLYYATILFLPKWRSKTKSNKPIP